MPGRFLTLLLLAIPAPVMAADASQVPEGSSLTLFALGILGVIVGRKLSMGPKD